MNASIKANKQNSHFNLHTVGVGYLNRVRWVEAKGAGRKSAPFLCCAISALRGNSDAPDYTYFDLRVSGEEAIEMVKELQVDVENNRKVVISFRVGDIYPHVYMRRVKDQSGRQTGESEPAAIIKGRLLLINSISINGENVYRRNEDDTTDPAQADTGVPSEDQAAGEGEQSDVRQSVQDDVSHETFDRPKSHGNRVAIPNNRQYQPRPQPAQRQSSAPQGRYGDAAYVAGHAVGRVAREFAKNS